MFSTPQVTDHTDFSFSRVEKKSEATRGILFNLPTDQK